MHRARLRSAAGGGRYCAINGAWLFAFKISVKLLRYSAIAQTVRPLFQLSLKRNAAKRPFLRKVFWRNRNDNRAVGIDAVPAGKAHAVYGQSFAFGRRIDDISARTHAKRIYAPAIRPLRRHFIRRRRQMDRHRSILALTDHLLWMLNPKPDGKRFCLHRNIAGMQHGKRISCAVPDGRYQNVGVQPVFVIDLNGAQRAILDV